MTLSKEESVRHITSRHRRRSVALFLATCAALATAGGIAYASIPGPDGVISGCRHKQSGALRVIDSSENCNNSTEVALSWNQTGAQGPPGSLGPSDAYFASTEYQRLNEETVLVSVDVPSGSYTVVAKTHLYPSFGSWLLTCELRAGNLVLDYQGVRLTPDDSRDQAVPLLGVASFEDGGTIALVCDVGDGPIESEQSQLIATKVGEIH
jgi:hypothetical protein